MKERGERNKQGVIMKALLDRCLSKHRNGGRPEPPEGSFAVYVGGGGGGGGAARERFVVRTECVNHPLFRALLEEAEEEYGYVADGPLELPCDAGEFVAVLARIEREMAEERTVGCAGGLVFRLHPAAHLMLVAPATPPPMIVG
jgi:SAUR family protein